MNRCVRSDRNASLLLSGGLAWAAARRWLLAVAALMVLTAPAFAGMRVFPMDTKRGEITFAAPLQVQVNGKTEQIGPGTRIHDAQNNRLVFAATLQGQTFVVNYVRDGTGMIREIWILTPGEIREKLPPTQDELNRMRQWQNENAAASQQLN